MEQLCGSGCQERKEGFVMWKLRVVLHLAQMLGALILSDGQKMVITCEEGLITARLVQ